MYGNIQNLQPRRSPRRKETSVKGENGVKTNLIYLQRMSKV